MFLSTLTVKNAKPADRAFKLADGGGLYLLVKPNGTRLWRLDYRYGGKRKTAAFGAFPEVSLAEARDRRDAARKLLRDGVDPMEVKRAEKQRQAASVENAFEAVTKTWFEARKARWKTDYSDRIMRHLEIDIFPELGHRPIGEIEPPELLSAVRKIERRGAVVLSKKVLQLTGQVFRFAIAEGKAKRDPSRDLIGALRSPPPVKHRAALTAADLPVFLAKLESYEGDERTRLGIWLILLTMVRTSEARFATWGEFEGLDGAEPLWRIPANRMKKKREHLVPLPRQAVEVLNRLKELTYGSPYVFPAPTKAGVISENTFLYALYRMGYHTQATVHGFRGTASTILNEQGFHPDWVEVALAHVDENKIRAAYNSAQYLSGRRKMLDWWANYLAQCRDIGTLVG